MSLNDQFNNFQTSNSNSSSSSDLSNASDVQLYQFAMNMHRSGSMPSQIKNAMINRGVDQIKATMIVNSLTSNEDDVKKAAAKRDILFGSLWLVGGLVLTLSGIGVIWYGAIIVGIIQLIKGLVNLNA